MGMRWIVRGSNLTVFDMGAQYFQKLNLLGVHFHRHNDDPQFLPSTVNNHLHRLWSNHSFVRFTVVGCTNAVLMFVIFLLFVHLLADFSHGRTFAWSISWGLECTIAYFLHRLITFRYEGAMASSFARTMLIYGIALVGSSFTYDMLDYKLGLSYPIPWLCTGSFWGVSNYFLIGWYAMRQSKIT